LVRPDVTPTQQRQLDLSTEPSSPYGRRVLTSHEEHLVSNTASSPTDRSRRLMPGHENTHYKAQQTFEDEPLFTKYSRNKNHAVQREPTRQIRWWFLFRSVVGRMSHYLSRQSLTVFIHSGQSAAQ